MTENELHWLAGLLEGEGCFTTTGKAKCYPAVYMVSTDRDVVKRAAALMGCNVQILKHTSEISRKPQHRAVVQGTKAKALMEAVLPLMGTRRSERIRELLTTFKEG